MWKQISKSGRLSDRFFSDKDYDFFLKMPGLLFEASGEVVTYLYPSTSASTWGPLEHLGSPPAALSACLSTPVLCSHFASVLPQTTNEEILKSNCIRVWQHQKTKTQLALFPLT